MRGASIHDGRQRVDGERWRGEWARTAYRAHEGKGENEIATHAEPVSSSRRLCGASKPSDLNDPFQSQIRDGLDAQFVDVVDMSGDARHVGIQVMANAFEGKNAINRQRMVYKCIWEEMQTDKVHAVQTCVTKTPAEAESK